MPLVRRTRATLRSAEFGFFGVCVKTRTQTPRFCGLSLSAGLLVFVTMASRPLRTSWLIVGTRSPVASDVQNGRPGTQHPAGDDPAPAGSTRTCRAIKAQDRDTG